MKRFVRSAIVEHSAQEMFALVERIESYPEFVPWCLSAVVHERAGDRTVATLEVGYKGLRQSLTTLNLNRPGESIDMSLLKGPFKAFAAGWRFKPLGTAAARIEFHLEYEFSSPTLGRALGPLFNNLANTMVDVFTRRAEALHGKNAR